MEPMISYIVTIAVGDIKRRYRAEQFMADDISHALEQAEDSIEPDAYEYVVAIREESCAKPL